MVGVYLGGQARKYIQGEAPSTTLDFDYTDAELDEIRSGRMPDVVAGELGRRGKAVLGRAMKVHAPLFAVFVALSAVVFAVAENGRVAVPILLMSLWAAFAGIQYLQHWLRYRRPLRRRVVKPQTLRAYKSFSDYTPTVRFGQTAMTGKSWAMDMAAFNLINDDGLYNVYAVADMLVYLEEVAEPPTD